MFLLNWSMVKPLFPLPRTLPRNLTGSTSKKMRCLRLENLRDSRGSLIFKFQVVTFSDLDFFLCERYDFPPPGQPERIRSLGTSRPLSLHSHNDGWTTNCLATTLPETNRQKTRKIGRNWPKRITVCPRASIIQRIWTDAFWRLPWLVSSMKRSAHLSSTCLIRFGIPTPSIWMSSGMSSNWFPAMVSSMTRSGRPHWRKA